MLGVLNTALASVSFLQVACTAVLVAVVSGMRLAYMGVVMWSTGAQDTKQFLKFEYTLHASIDMC